MRATESAVERDDCVESVSVSENPLELLELAVDGECIIACCTGGSAANVCFRELGNRDVRPLSSTCFNGTALVNFASRAAAFSAFSASSSSRLRAASLRAIVAFLAPAEALAACTRTAFRVSLLMPASNATKEMPPCARGLEDDAPVVFEALAPLPLALFAAPGPFGACDTIGPDVRTKTGAFMAGYCYSFSWELYERAGCQGTDIDRRATSSNSGEVRSSQAMAGISLGSG